jgi:hypothetical protein
MRTCAAHLATASVIPNPAAIDDAAALLLAAADEIDVLTGPINLGEPMEVIPPVVTPPPVVSQTSAMWVAPGGQLPLEWARHRSKTACPKCDSRTQKKVYRTIDRTVMLVCPVCAHEWPYIQ